MSIPAHKPGFSLTREPKKQSVENREHGEKIKWVENNRKKRYRGKGKVNKKENIFTILLVNMRGFNSKETSLRKILRKKRPISMVLINETLLRGKAKVSLPSYICWSKNRADKGGGGPLQFQTSSKIVQLGLGRAKGTMNTS